MDPNHWNQYNQAYGRLGTSATMAGGSAPLNRYDLGLLEQPGLGGPGMSGLGTLSPSLGPAHSLNPARGMAGLPNLNYGHPVHSSMSQLLDTMNSLGQSFPNPPTYKGLPPTPSQHMYGLPDPLMGLSEPLGDNQMPKSLFNTDPHTMKETSSSMGDSYGSVSTPTDSKSSWGLSNFVPPPSNPFGNLSESPGSVFSLAPEPPPAHSGSRPSTIQRNPYQKQEYQAKNDFPIKSSYQLKNERSSRSDYHSGGNSEYPIKSDFHSSDFPAKPEYQPRSQKSEYQSVAKSQSTGRHSQSFMDSLPRTSDHGMQQTLNHSQSTLPSHGYPPSPQVSNSSSYPESPHLHKSQTSHSQQRTSEYNSYFTPSVSSAGYNSLPNNSVTYTSASNVESVNYDPVSPPTQLPSSRSHNSHSTHTSNFTMSLQELTNLSNQEKLHLSDTQAHMANSSPIRVQNKIQGMGGVPSTPSPMQPSPISVGSPQVPMTSPHMSGPMASPQMASSSIPPVPIPIQAVADSTTKPKRSRSRKKKEKTPDLKMMYPGPPPPLTSPHQMSQHQPLTPQQPTTPSAHHHLLHQENPDRYSISESDTSIYMTNSYEEAFMAPQLIDDAMMPIESQATNASPLVTHHLDHQTMQELEPPVDCEPMQTIDPNALMNTGFSHSALQNLETLSFPNEQVPKPKQKRSRTKAEQKEMPGAFYTEPSATPVREFIPAEMVQDDEFSHLLRDPLNEEPKQTFVPKKGTGVSSFQSSFLSFLQGNKQETLSCITNSVVSKKPAVPKNFLPDAPRLNPETFDASPTLLADPDLKMKSIDVPAVTFSDDEDNSMALSKTVQNVISNLSDDSKGESLLSSPPSVASQQSTFLTTEQERIGKNVPAATNLPVKSGKHKMVEGNDRDPDFVPGVEIEEESDDGDIFEKKTSRKPKEKKAKEKKQKKKRKKKRRDAEGGDASSESEKGYDSDKDPIWIPFDQPPRQRLSSDSDEKKSGRGKNKRERRASCNKTSKRSRTYRNVGVINTSGGVLMEDSPCHKFQKGDFVVENRAIVGDTYPVWKIDAGRLLQKYEPFEYKGIKCHKGLSTYSSWSPELKDQYKAIAVQPIHNDTYELVQIIDKNLRENGTTPDDPLLEDFNVFMQILISQALESSFLRVVQEEGEEFYLLPLEKIDALIAQTKKNILEKVNWTEKFRESVEQRPYLNCVDRLGLSKACQACQDHSQPAIKSVELYGSPYDPVTLDTLDHLPCPPSDEFLIGELTATYLSTYHTLHHFKFSTFKRCTAKVNLIKDENPEVQGHDILDQCLQNRNWVLKIFQDFTHALSKSGGSMDEDGT